MKSPLAIAALAVVLVAVTLPESADAVRFRCGIFSFLGNDRACRASCWVRGKKTGMCDEDNNCVCGQKDLDIPESVRTILGGLDVLEYVQIKSKEFMDEVNSWSITEEVKAHVPSRCRLGNGFCESSCHAIGRTTGACNADFSDCACSDTTVTPREFSLCVEDGICSVYCQRNDFARGECRGKQGWTCECITLEGKTTVLGEEETDAAPVTTTTTTTTTTPQTTTDDIYDGGVVDMDDYEDFRRSIGMN